MSRARDAITKAAESRGWTVMRIDYEPLGIVMEKAGQAGGWDVSLVRDGVEDQALGYNVAQVIQWIKNLDDGWDVDPFSCSGKTYGLVAGDCTAQRGHKGPHYPYQPREEIR